MSPEERSRAIVDQASDSVAVAGPGLEKPRKRVAVIMQRRVINSRWQSEVWEPVGVLADYEGEAGRRVIVEEPEATQWLYPGFDIVLQRAEAEGYFHNVSTAAPNVFVLWRMVAKWPTHDDVKTLWRLPTLFKTVQQKAIADKAYEKFPLILTSGRLVEYEGGGDETRSNPWLAELQQEAFVEINPKAAADRGIRNGEFVWLGTPSGARLKVKAQVTERVGPDTCFMISGARRTTKEPHSAIRICAAAPS